MRRRYNTSSTHILLKQVWPNTKVTERERNIIIKTKSIYTWLYTKFPVQPLVKIVLSQTSKHTQKKNHLVFLYTWIYTACLIFFHLYNCNNNINNRMFVSKKNLDDITWQAKQSYNFCVIFKLKLMFFEQCCCCFH